MISTNLNLLPEFSKLNENEKKNVTEYLLQLNDTEIKAFKIAIDHLQSSFNILKSNGYLNWKKTQN